MIKIITIGREFGSGGRSIDKEVTEKLGIPCYDKDFIEKSVTLIVDAVGGVVENE